MDLVGGGGGAGPSAGQGREIGRGRTKSSREGRRGAAQTQPRARPNRSRGGLRSSLRSLRSVRWQRSVGGQAARSGGSSGAAWPPPALRSVPPPLQKTRGGGPSRSPPAARPPQHGPFSRPARPRNCPSRGTGGSRGPVGRRFGATPALSASFSALLSPALPLALGPRTWLGLGRAATTLARGLGAPATDFAALARRRPRSAPSPHQVHNTREGEGAEGHCSQRVVVSLEGLALAARGR
ncbi:hypothetical protein ES705_45510 [subsurface metagenome]